MDVHADPVERSAARAGDGAGDVRRLGKGRVGRGRAAGGHRDPVGGGLGRLVVEVLVDVAVGAVLHDPLAGRQAAEGERPGVVGERELLVVPVGHEREDLGVCERGRRGGIHDGSGDRPARGQLGVEPSRLAPATVTTVGVLLGRDVVVVLVDPAVTGEVDPVVAVDDGHAPGAAAPVWTTATSRQVTTSSSRTTRRETTTSAPLSGADPVPVAPVSVPDSCRVGAARVALTARVWLSSTATSSACSTSASSAWNSPCSPGRTEADPVVAGLQPRHRIEAARVGGGRPHLPEGTVAEGVVVPPDAHGGAAHDSRGTGDRAVDPTEAVQRTVDVEVGGGHGQLGGPARRRAAVVPLRDVVGVAEPHSIGARGHGRRVVPAGVGGGGSRSPARSGHRSRRPCAARRRRPTRRQRPRTR